MKIENVVYIITNPQYPGYIKIGYASDLKQRLSSLNTGALVEFEPYAVYETPKENGDLEIHRIIKLLNPILRSSKFDESKVKLKEFFKIEPEEAFELFEHIAIVSGTRHKLYRVDKYLNKFDCKPKSSVTTDNDSNKDDDKENISSTTQPSPPIQADNNCCIPNGLYTLKTKLKKSNLTIVGKMEVVDGRYILKAGSNVAPENERYDSLLKYFENLKILNNTLMEDVEVDAVSAAACIVRGKPSNGWDLWKDKNGNPISVYRKK